MALFARRPAVPSTAPDGAFPYWDQVTADEFRELVRAAFAKVGIEVVVRADRAADAGGRVYQLANLAAGCQSDRRGPRGWRRRVREHVEAVHATLRRATAIDDLSDAELLASTYCRVVPTSELPDSQSYAAEIAPGLSRVFNLDRPKAVAYFNDEQVARLGADAMLAAGLANLRRVAVDKRDRVDSDGATVEVLLGDSLFTASLVLIFDEVLARYRLTVEPGTGVFVAVPNRHQLQFHLPRDRSAVESLSTLARLAALTHRDAVGPISPSVYWWRPHAVERVSAVADHEITLQASAELTEVLHRLAR